MRVAIQNGGAKPWVRVWTLEEGSLVAFEDMFEMIRGIIRCDVVKYGGDPDNPADWARWGKMPAAFMEDAAKFDATYEELARKHLFPPKPSPVVRPSTSVSAAPPSSAKFDPYADLEF